MRRLFVLAALCFALPAHAVTIDWVTVGDPGNAAACSAEWGCGAVDYVYSISKYQVTNAQYAEFLNAVAVTDTYGLYNTSMGSGYGGITRSGSSGSYTYSTIADRGNMPVNYVSFWDSLRFANWLHNGQGSGDTESGAYTITPAGIAANSITRNADATIFLTSEAEWYKTAYYDAVSTSYFDYPAGSDAEITCALPGATPNTANCGNVVGDLTDVGSYTGSASPNGTFDQGGNVFEWNEAIISGDDDPDWARGLWGGSFLFSPISRAQRLGTYPTDETPYVGFRVAMIPEPTTALLLAMGLAGLAAAGRRRRQ